MLWKASWILFHLTVKIFKDDKIHWQTCLSHTKLLYWSGSMSESQQELKQEVRLASCHLGWFILWLLDIQVTLHNSLFIQTSGRSKL